MEANGIGVFLALASFALTFVVARLLSSAIKKRRAAREQVRAERQQSRQVRRALERRNKR